MLGSTVDTILASVYGALWKLTHFLRAREFWETASGISLILAMLVSTVDITFASVSELFEEAHTSPTSNWTRDPEVLGIPALCLCHPAVPRSESGSCLLSSGNMGSSGQRFRPLGRVAPRADVSG